MFDQSAYHKEYRKINKEKIRKKQEEWHERCPSKRPEYTKRYYATHRKQIRENAKRRRREHPQETRAKDRAYRESTPYRYLSHRFSQLKKEKHHGKTLPQYKTKITRGYLCGLWDKQEGCCAITGKAMVHKNGSLYTVSVDRIDSSLGYVEGNVQLVCKAINLAKNHHADAEIRAFWNER